MQNRRTKQEQRVLAHYALQEGGKALEEGLMRNAECKMQNAKCKIQNAKCKMQNAKCGMQNAGFTIIERYISFKYATISSAFGLSNQ